MAMVSDDVNAVSLPLCREDIPVLIMLKAMGLESDQEAVDLIGPEPAFEAMLQPSLQAAKDLSIFTQLQALDYLGAPSTLLASTCFWSTVLFAQYLDFGGVPNEI